MTDAPDPAAIPLPEMPPRRTPLGRFTSPVHRAAFRFVPPLTICFYMSIAETLRGVLGKVGAALVVGLGFGLVAGASDFFYGRARRRRFERERRLRPNEPWFWDHPWNPAGVALSPGARALLHTEARLSNAENRVRLWFVLACVGIAVIGVVLAARGLGTVSLAIVGAFVTWLAWKTWRLHGAGTCHVAFAKFPFHPGERVTLYLGMSEGGATFQRAEFHLRRIYEVSSSPFGRGRGAFTSFVGTLRRPPGPLPGPELDVELSFDVPADAEGTRLSAREATYWVLDVVADTSAGPYVESFLVPIYERPAPAAESAA